MSELTFRDSLYHEPHDFGRHQRDPLGLAVDARRATQGPSITTSRSAA